MTKAPRRPRSANQPPPAAQEPAQAPSGAEALFGGPDAPAAAPAPPAGSGSRMEHGEMALGELARYGKNSRTHSPEQVEALAKAMLRFGWTTPILRRGETGIIAAGHGRLQAAELLLQRGHTQFARVPVITAWGWSEDDFRAYVIWDNRSAELAGWDKNLLRTELQALHHTGFDLQLTGFSLEDAGLKPPNFQPVNFTARLDQKEPITCPSCGHKFQAP